jgi:hypothetical protein
MILLDVHVHLYDCFDRQRFCAATLHNFANQPVLKQSNDGWSAVVFLTDWAKQNWFQRLSQQASARRPEDREVVPGWQIAPTQEGNAVRISRTSNGDGFYLVAGRKVITSENLELLALFLHDPIPDGQPLQALVSEVSSRGGVAVIPWAFGKWSGSRGRVVSDLLESATGHGFFLCDNGNRPAVWPRPPLFSQAERRGIRILSGSDPLHFASEAGRAGRVGVACDGRLPPERPASYVKHLMGDRATVFTPFGRLEKLHRFLFIQSLMQIQKRRFREQMVNV